MNIIINLVNHRPHVWFHLLNSLMLFYRILDLMIVVLSTIFTLFLPLRVFSLSGGLDSLHAHDGLFLCSQDLDSLLFGNEVIRSLRIHLESGSADSRFIKGMLIIQGAVPMGLIRILELMVFESLVTCEGRFVISSWFQIINLQGDVNWVFFVIY